MKVQLSFNGNMKITGTNETGQKTLFDSHPDVGGESSAPTPMEVMLQAMGACSFMDVLSILKKKRKTITDLIVHINGERAKEHPRVFTRVELVYELVSPDAEIKDLERSIELSQTTYCGAAAMFRRSGCEVTYSARILRPEEVIG